MGGNTVIRSCNHVYRMTSLLCSLLSDYYSAAVPIHPTSISFEETSSKFLISSVFLCFSLIATLVVNLLKQA